MLNILSIYVFLLTWHMSNTRLTSLVSYMLYQMHIKIQLDTSVKYWGIRYHVKYFSNLIWNVFNVDPTKIRHTFSMVVFYWCLPPEKYINTVYIYTFLELSLSFCFVCICSVSSAQCCQCLWIDCPFLIAPSLFSNFCLLAI